MDPRRHCAASLRRPQASRLAGGLTLLATLALTAPAAAAPPVPRPKAKDSSPKASLSGDLRQQARARRSRRAAQPNALRKGRWTLARQVDLDADRLRAVLAAKSESRRRMIRSLEAILRRHGYEVLPSILDEAPAPRAAPKAGTAPGRDTGGVSAGSRSVARPGG